MNKILSEFNKGFINIFIIILSFIGSVSLIMVIYYFTFHSILLMILGHILSLFIVYFITWKVTKDYSFRYLVLGIYLLSLLFILIGQFSVENKDKVIPNNIKEKNSLFENKSELQNYKNASLHEKIKILKTLGLTKSEVSYRLRNDMRFKELTKDGLEDFNTIYNSN